MVQVGEGRSKIGRVDLHIHTLASDGASAPEEVAAMAGQAGLEAMAITDHETTLGVFPASAAAQEWGVEVIPGLELTAEEAGEEFHILGYFVDVTDRPLQDSLLRLRRQRRERALKIIDRLAQMGMPLDWDWVGSQTWDSVGRPHIARSLWQRGYVSTPKEAFDRYLDPGRPAHVALPRPSIPQALELIQGAGGLPVLAHPIIPGRDEPRERMAHLRSILPFLLECGLVGVEAYYPEYPQQLTWALVDLARAQGLVPTGGSDFHGPDWRLSQVGGVYVPAEVVGQLRRMARPAKSLVGGA